jgi:hypothetical protein
MGLSKGASIFSRLPWIVGLIVAAMLAIGTVAPASARHVLTSPGLHKASTPVDGHHFDLSAKHHRSVHHLGRRFVPDPALASADAGVPRPSALERVSLPAGGRLLVAGTALLPPKTGPPRV